MVVVDRGQVDVFSVPAEGREEHPEVKPWLVDAVDRMCYAANS